MSNWVNIDAEKNREKKDDAAMIEKHRNLDHQKDTFTLCKTSLISEIK